MRHAAASLRQSRVLVPGLTQLADGLLILAVLLLFTLSANALFALGSSYGQPGGNPLTKIHPGTFVAGAALLASLLAVGPRRGLERLLARWPAAAFGFLATSFAVIYVAAVLRLPITPIVETFLMPGVLVAALSLRQPRPPVLPRLLHGLFAANAALALIEFTTHWRLSPFVAGATIIADWRSTALFGHPLANALLTTTYVATLLFSPPHGLSQRWRMPALAFQVAALVAFGGRTAIVMAALLVGGSATLRVARILSGERVRIGSVLLCVLAVVMAVAGTALLFAGGVFDLLLDRFTNDAGSAKTRIIMFRVLGAIPTEALWLGPDPHLVEDLMQREGSEYGIESFPVSLTLDYGIVVAGCLVAGMAALLWDVAKATRPASFGVVAVFLLVAVSFLSLGAKSVAIAQLCTVLLIFYGRPRLSPLIQAKAGIQAHQELLSPTGPRPTPG